jgi:membrane-associated protein
MDLLLNPEKLILSAGYVGLFFIIFAESGLFFGFFLPGDSLLLTAGLLASRGVAGLNVVVLIPLLFVAAVLGDSVGYWFGAKTGPRIFNRDDSLLFRRKNLVAAKAFYEKHGGKTIVLARFMPFIRTFAPIVAGAADMRYRSFLSYNLIGGALWSIGVTLAGYFLAALIPQDQLDRYFTFIVIGVIILSALPTLIHLWREERHAIFGAVRKLSSRGPGEIE